LVCDVGVDTCNNFLSLSPCSSCESYETIEENRHDRIIEPMDIQPYFPDLKNDESSKKDHDLE
jgi:hypothetical protein